MLWLILYCVLSVIIARWLEKRMRFAAIFHSIMFIVITVYLLLLCDARYLVNAFEYLLGKESYGAFKEALLSTYYAYSFEISVFAILEMMLLFMSIIVLAVTAVKLVEKAVQAVRKNLGAFKQLKAEEKYILVEWHCAKKIYLHFCRLLNW